ncbi:MAG: SRPBCC family protein [Pseudomonadota bacterium]
MAEHLRHLGVSINRPMPAVYGYTSLPENFPNWATGLGSSLIRQGDTWLADSPAGQVRIRFSEKNAYGVLDHWVTLPNGQLVYIPLRVIANGEQSELIFTLLRQPEMDDEKFTADAAWVMRDLNRLKEILEAA